MSAVRCGCRIYFMDIFAVKKDVSVANLTLQPEEVVDAKWISDAELREMIAEGKVVYSVGLRYQKYAELIK